MTTPRTDPQPPAIAAFFAQTTVTVAVRAVYLDGRVAWPAITGRVLGRDADGLLLEASDGIRYIPWNIVVSVRAGMVTDGGW